MKPSNPNALFFGRCGVFATLLFLTSPAFSQDFWNVGIAYTGEVLSNRRGGIEQQSAYLDNLDLTLAVDTGSPWDSVETDLYFHVLYNNGAQFSDSIVGDYQVVSNIETGVEALRMFEAWFRIEFANQTDLLVGLFDLNSEFDVLNASQLFTGSAHGIGTDISQAGLNGPSIFPVTGLAVRVSHRLSEQWGVRGALIDGVPGDPENPDATTIKLSGDEGVLAILELEWLTETSRVLGGIWGYSARFGKDPLGLGSNLSDPVRGNFGAYLRGEKIVSVGEQRVSVFGRIGYAHGDFNAFDYFLSAGVTMREPIPGRYDDELGLAVAWAETSSSVEDLAGTLGEAVDSREITLELTYRALAGHRWFIQPTLQYVVNPGINPALGNALVAGLRFEVALIR